MAQDLGVLTYFNIKNLKENYRLILISLKENNIIVVEYYQEIFVMQMFIFLV